MKEKIKKVGRNRNAASATLGKSLAVSVFPLYVPVKVKRAIIPAKFPCLAGQKVITSHKM